MGEGVGDLLDNGVRAGDGEGGEMGAGAGHGFDFWTGDGVVLAGEAFDKGGVGAEHWGVGGGGAGIRGHCDEVGEVALVLGNDKLKNGSVGSG